jgi:acyl-CoA thioesterase-2
MMPDVTADFLDDIVTSLDLAAIDDDTFRATQLDNPVHHIVGGHIAAQSLMAASRTVADRRPHSVHVYFLRAGDARYPVTLQVTRLRDGGTLSTRRVTAVQDGQVLLEAIASFSGNVDGIEYHQPLPELPDPESLPPVQELLRPYADEFGGWWVNPHPLDRRYVDPPPRLSLDQETPSPHIRMWWRPVAPVPVDVVLGSCLLTYVSGTTMLETATAMRRTTSRHSFSALIDHALWFHRPVDLSDWVMSDQVSPSGIDGRGLASATMYNRSGELVSTASQETYFGRTKPVTP